MDWKLELVAVPVSDVDRAKAFYTEQVGFNADHDHQVSEDLRFVQLTPPRVGLLHRARDRYHRHGAGVAEGRPDGRLRCRRGP